MSFWKSVANVASTIGKEIITVAANTLENSKEYTNEMETKSDSQLIATVRKNKGVSMYAVSAMVEIKKRGYSQEYIR
ncbi:hypothetical protein [Vibrio owensii]|uniref:hypothetical protein n=1 Tax=Vibrio owensii TaxID=696485 RepID=UPI0022DD282D|nr:hypothetical protein [Vibrio owensii]MDA0385968.1 hypothetical protein [Vibrio owensii]